MSSTGKLSYNSIANQRLAAYSFNTSKMLKPFFGAAILAVFAMVFSGCSEQTPSETETPSADSNTSVDSTQSLTQAVASTSTTESSPAKANQLPPKTAGPDEVCDRFLACIQSGNLATAELLLTNSALANTSNAGLELEPLGGPTATYEVSDVRFATTKKKLAHVSCAIREPGTQRIDVVWTMKRQISGWRISGVILENGAGGRDLLSFENPMDVAQMKGQAPTESDSESLISTNVDAAVSGDARTVSYEEEIEEDATDTVVKPETKQASHDEPTKSTK